MSSQPTGNAPGQEEDVYYEEIEVEEEEEEEEEDVLVVTALRGALDRANSLLSDVEAAILINEDSEVLLGTLTSLHGTQVGTSLSSFSSHLRSIVSVMHDLHTIPTVSTLAEERFLISSRLLRASLRLQSVFSLLSTQTTAEFARMSVSHTAEVEQMRRAKAGPQGLVTLIFTDVQGSTKLWMTAPTTMKKALAVHNRVLRDLISRFGAFEVKTEGDAFMVAFSDATVALRWCVEAQCALYAADWPPELQPIVDKLQNGGAPGFKGLNVRMGGTTGYPMSQIDETTGRSDYFGNVVNLAARISSIGQGGEIIVGQNCLVRGLWRTPILQQRWPDAKPEEEEAVHDVSTPAPTDRLPTEPTPEALALVTGVEIVPRGPKEFKGIIGSRDCWSLYPKELAAARIGFFTAQHLESRAKAAPSKSNELDIFVIPGTESFMGASLPSMSNTMSLTNIRSAVERSPSLRSIDAFPWATVVHRATSHQGINFIFSAIDVLQAGKTIPSNAVAERKLDAASVIGGVCAESGDVNRFSSVELAAEIFRLRGCLRRREMWASIVSATPDFTQTLRSVARKFLKAFNIDVKLSQQPTDDGAKAASSTNQQRAVQGTKSPAVLEKGVRQEPVASSQKTVAQNVSKSSARAGMNITPVSVGGNKKSTVNKSPPAKAGPVVIDGTFPQDSQPVQLHNVAPVAAPRENVVSNRKPATGALTSISPGAKSPRSFGGGIVTGTSLTPQAIGGIGAINFGEISQPIVKSWNGKLPNL